MIPKIDRRRKTRLLVESAILKARMPSDTDAIRKDDLEATLHLFETQVFNFKSAKNYNVAELRGISKKLHALSIRTLCA